MSNITAEQEAKRYFSRELLAWYDEHKRDLPWRRSRNPYHIWISEIMLQQTRVDTVIPYFLRFVEKFPTVEILANAPEEEVLKCWEGLGYYSRARNIQSAAKQVVERHGGIVPDTPEEISALKGIGPYTAGAVLSIAYNVPVPAVDGNVMRVLSRYFCLEDDIAKNPTRIKMEKLAGELIPAGRASDFNQALMELGALICTPKSPHCLTCPVMKHCKGRINGMEEQLPIKTKAKPPRPEHRLLAVIEGEGEHAGKVLIRQRPATGLLARMWELPHVIAEESKKAGAGAGLSEEAAMQRLSQALHNEGVDIRPGEAWMTAEHTFSHIQWYMRVFLCTEVNASAEQAASTAAENASANTNADVSVKDTDPSAIHTDAKPSRGTRQPQVSKMQELEQGTLDIKLSGTTPESLENIRQQLAVSAATDTMDKISHVAEQQEAYAAVPSTLLGEAFDYDYRWISREDMEKYAFPNLFLKILQQYFNEK
ncbi:A/G-specific adenine glycosylase [Paenibacillus wulumuqiensis]|uniref:A/G-specific adenine glycosylase n=1 Tax=Paenibacillus wulumuqiensis TaxID=1567107 RepID=UPI000619E37C|nr:A/G-specific adenine glycosylase [Paenibacillus wulumuqiensis]